MSLGGVSNEGNVMPPHFFEKGKDIIKQIYLNVLQYVVKLWFDQVTDRRLYLSARWSTNSYDSSRPELDRGPFQDA